MEKNDAPHLHMVKKMTNDLHKSRMRGPIGPLVNQLHRTFDLTNAIGIQDRSKRDKICDSQTICPI